MPKLINTSDNLLIDVPDNGASEGFLAGKYAIPKGQPQVMTSPEGKLMTVPAEHVYDAIKQGGYSFAPTQAIHEADMEARYGGAEGAVKSAALGAANALSFGGASQLLEKTGVASPEALNETEKRSPLAYAAGEATGIVGGLVLAPEATAPGLIEKAGLKAAGALLKEAPEGVALASKIAANAARKGLGSAVEGALYGVGNEINEQALGDPSQNAERVMAHVGMSALLGGGLGSVFGAAEEALPAALSRAKEASNKLLEKASPKAAEAFDKAATFVSGQPRDLITLIRENRAELGGSPEEVRAFSERLSKGIQDQYSSINKATREAFKDLRPEESARLVSNVEAGPVFEELGRISDKLQIAIRDMRAKPEIYPQRFPSKLEELVTGLNADLQGASSSAEAYKILDDLKSNLSKQIKFGKIPSEESMDAQALIKGLRGDIKASLENEAIWGEAGARQSAFNSAFNEFKTVQDELQSKFMRKVRTKQGGVSYTIDPVKVNTFLNQVGDIRGELRSDILERYSQASDKVIEEIEKSYKNLPEKAQSQEELKALIKRVSGITDEFEGRAAIKRAYEKLTGTGGYGSVRGGGVGDVGAALAVSVAKAAGVPYSVAAPLVGMYEILRYPSTSMQRLAKLESIMNRVDLNLDKGAKALFSGGSSSIGPSSYLVSKSLADDYSGKIERINHLVNNPDALQPRLEEMTERIHGTAPNTATALQAAATRGAVFLQSKIPSAPVQYPMQEKWVPGPTEKARFLRYYNAVEKPLDALKQMRQGTLSKETMEVLQTVYPTLYRQMQEHVVDAATSYKGTVPYYMKQQISLFLEKDMTAATTPMSILFNQKALGGGGAQVAQSPMPKGQKVPTTAKLTSGSNFLTPMQRSAARR